MKIYFKIMTWEEIEIPDELSEKAKEIVISGEATSTDDILNLLSDSDDAYFDIKHGDYKETMTVEENEGWSTIEICEGETTIWQNGKSS